MSSREERPSTWQTDPEATPASGGQLAPDIPGGSRFDPLNAPLPSEVERLERERATQRTEVVPPAPTPVPRRRPPSGRRMRGPSRRVRRTLLHVDPLTVLKISMFFYACMMVLWLIFVAFVYWFVESLGFFRVVREISTGFAVENPEITLGLVEKWAFLIGFTFFVVGSLVNTFLAFLYNVGADTLGGINLTFSERDLG